MELRTLEYFLAVADTGSFTRAARRVHVVQSALSVSVRALEKELGATLFERTTRRVELTEAGRALVSAARETLAAAQAARDVVSEVSGGVRGTVRIGIMHSLPGVDLATLITRFHREQPGVRIVPSTHPHGSVGLARDVAKHALDIAFAAVDGAAHPTLDAVELFDEPIRLACPPGHRLAGRRLVRLAELTDEPFIDLPPRWGSRMSVDRLFGELGLHREVTVEVGDVATVLELVRAGLGVALLAPSSAPSDARAGLVAVRPSPVFTVRMLTAGDRRLSAAASRFADLARRTLTAGASAGGRIPCVDPPEERAP